MRKSPASAPFVIHTLPPSMTQPPPALSRVARVFSAKASEPLPGSESANDATSLVARRGSAQSWSAGDPHFLKTLFTSVFCTSTMTAVDASRLANSSIARHAATKDAPAPPCRSGISMPMKPDVCSARTSAGSSRAALSIASTLAGGRCSAQKAAAASRMESSASVNAPAPHTGACSPRTATRAVARAARRRSIVERAF